jgi:hypothetical protein
VPDVADDRLVLHPLHVLERDDVLVAGRRDEDVGGLDDVVQRHDLVALHRRLQRADRVDLGDHHPAALALEALARALAHVAVAADHRDLAAEHDVAGAVQPVDQRVTAAVHVVELALRDAVVDVDRREGQLARSANWYRRCTPVVVSSETPLISFSIFDHWPGFSFSASRSWLRNAPNSSGCSPARTRGSSRLTLELGALEHHHRRVAAVVEDQVRARRPSSSW